MSTEFPIFNTLQNQPENKSGINTFLRDQIRLPEEKWSSEFRALVEKELAEMKEFMERMRKIREGEEEEYEESPEAEREHTFRRYLEKLGLHEEDLRGKRIMDLGFGEGGFVKHLVAKGIAPETYGIDISPYKDSLEKGFTGHLFKGSSEDDLPVQDLDYIVAIRSIWPDWKGKDGYVMNAGNVLEKSLAALKEGGEMRIYPLAEAAKRNSDDDKGLTEEVQKKWDAVLSALSEKHELEYELEPRDIFVDPSNKNVTLHSVLIIRKHSQK